MWRFDTLWLEDELYIRSTLLSVQTKQNKKTIYAPGLTYENLFRIIIMRFIDAYNFDVRAVKKSCVHIIHKDGRIIPFETMNLFYRDDKESYLKKLLEEKDLTNLL